MSSTPIEPLYVVDTHALIWYLLGDKKWFADFKTIYQDILSRQFFKFLPFDSRHVLDFDRDDLVPEMHDRIITGTARRLGAPLISSDPLITSAAIVPIVW